MNIRELFRLPFLLLVVAGACRARTPTERALIARLLSSAGREWKIRTAWISVNAIALSILMVSLQAIYPLQLQVAIALWLGPVVGRSAIELVLGRSMAEPLAKLNGMSME